MKRLLGKKRCKRRHTLDRHAITGLAATKTTKKLNLTCQMKKRIMIIRVTLLNLIVRTIRELNILETTRNSNNRCLNLSANRRATAINAKRRIGLNVRKARIISATTIRALTIVRRPTTRRVFLRLMRTLLSLINLINVLLIGTDICHVMRKSRALITSTLIINIRNLARRIGNRILSNLRRNKIKVIKNRKRLLLTSLLSSVISGNRGLLINFIANRSNVRRNIIIRLINADLSRNRRIDNEHRHRIRLELLLLLHNKISSRLTVRRARRSAKGKTNPKGIKSDSDSENASRDNNLKLTIKIRARRNTRRNRIITRVLKRRKASKAISSTENRSDLLTKTTLATLRKTKSLTRQVRLLLMIRKRKRRIGTLAKLNEHNDNTRSNNLTMTGRTKTINRLNRLANLRSRQATNRNHFRDARHIRRDNLPPVMVYVFPTRKAYHF